MKKLYRSIVVSTALLAGAGLVHAAPERSAAQPASAVRAAGTSRPAAEDFVSRKQSVDVLFRALSSKMHKSVVLSAKAKTYKVSGSFDLNAPFSVLERVSSDLGLIWYYDGQVIYVYDPMEMRSAVLSLAHISVGELEAHLRNAGLYDKRYELRGARGARTLYVSGPPKYVEIVTATASFLDQDQQRTNKAPSPDHRIESIRVKNAFVIDRTYERRDRTVVMPGITSVLRDVLERSDVNAQVSVAGSPVQGAPAFADAAASRPLTMELAAELGDAAFKRGQAPVASTAALPTMAPTPATGMLSVTQPATRRLTVVAYPDTNSLVVSGTTEQIEMIRRLVATLDTPRQQIEMSLWIIDVAKSDFAELGAKWSGTLNIGGSAQIGFNTPTSIPAGAASQFLATIGALSQQGKAQVVTRPVVLTQENIPAIFDNSKTFYVRLIGERDVNLQNVTYGTMISVTPKFDPVARRIEMALDIEDGSTVADEHGETQVAGLPIVGRTRINTVARVGHGESLLIGGYTRDQASNSVQKIPGLSRLPVVGKMFQYRDTSNTQAVRIFLIQPKALDEDAVFSPEQALGRNADVDSAVERLKRDLQ